MPITPLALLDRVLHGRLPGLIPVTLMLPLQGLTILAVEDSRYASDALRLMCHRSGARLRRVDTLQAAYAHLRVYRPDVILVDLGLPDGRGDALIRDLAQNLLGGPIVIAISGDAGAQAVANTAGAQGFIEKPFPNLAAFQHEILRHLPDRGNRGAPNPNADVAVPDTLALRDDWHHAANLLGSNPSPQQRRYVANFVAGIARAADDAALARAAVAATDAEGLDHLRQLLSARIHGNTDAFGDPKT